MCNFFFLITMKAYSSAKENIITNFSKINNLEFKFTQTINGKDESGECIISYPRKINCRYKLRFNKTIISNGNSLVITSDKNNQYYRYSLKQTPLFLLLDKEYILSQIKKLNINLIDDKYYLFSLNKNGNSINLFFDRKSFNIVGWQTEDLYQNLTITYIYGLKINKIINEKIFELPKLN